MARGFQIIEQERGDMPSDQISLATRLPDGGQMVSERTLFGDIITAQPIRAPRNEGRVLQKIEAEAGKAGSGWYYRFPVKKRGGGVDYIEGPSIECADSVARWYGNCQVASAIQDIGPAWIIHSRFVDLESGFTLVRPFLQSKTGSRLGGDDDERRMQMALSIGVSKSQRNVVVHALRDFTDRAFAAAKKNLVDRIGLKLAEYRQRCVAKLAEFGPDVLARVERSINRKADAWLAPDVARLVAEIQTVADGMSSADEVWPREAPPEPRRSDAAPAADARTVGNVVEGDTKGDKPADAPNVEAGSDTGDAPGAQERAPVPASESDEWALPAGLVGQDAVLDALGKLLARTKTASDVAEILMENAAAIGRITGQKKLQWNADVSERRRVIDGQQDLEP